MVSEGGGREGTPALDTVDGFRTRKAETGQGGRSGQAFLARAVSPGQGSRRGEGQLKREDWLRREGSRKGCF